jgi:hypothetical protein
MYHLVIHMLRKLHHHCWIYHPCLTRPVGRCTVLLSQTTANVIVEQHISHWLLFNPRQLALTPSRHVSHLPTYKCSQLCITPKRHSDSLWTTYFRILSPRGCSDMRVSALRCDLWVLCPAALHADARGKFSSTRCKLKPSGKLVSIVRIL